MGEIITKSFSRDFHLLLTPNQKGLMEYRRWNKIRAHRRYRRTWKKLIRMGEYDSVIPPFNELWETR